ncbi:hypothetical protein PVIIG_05893 [Plasmodium vivax India VII]|uniref:PIR Superfamily Protein n=1 Tax=Plasmodium vivax India VII TaxID=1077284 RepID=A0A0J9S209_PLAVI|nr:hypothetical protein PVIIG_05893 [Plasmodium vivax India VII]
MNSIFHADFENPRKECTNIYTKLKEEYTEIDNSFESNCNKAIAYLKYLEEAYEGEINTAKGSIYLYCWLCDVEFYKSNYNKNRLDIYKKLLEKYDLIENSSNIPNIFGNYLKDNIDDNLKNLYDLYYKFDKFRNNKNCTGNNCNCAKECYNSYNTYIKGCNNPDNAHFCNGLEEFRAQYNNYTSNGFKCNVEYKYLPSTKNFDIYLMDVSSIKT